MSNVKIRVLATPLLANIEIPYQELRSSFDEFWKAHQDEIIQHHGIKARKNKKGGHSPLAQQMAENRIGFTNLYGQVLNRAALKAIHGEERDILFVESFELLEFDPDKEFASMKAIFFLNPGIEFDESKLVKDIKDPVKEVFDDVFENAQKQIQYKFRELYDWDDKPIETGCRVLLDIIKDKTQAVRTTWYDFEEVPDSLKIPLTEHAKGDLFQVQEGEDFLNVKVHDVMGVDLPDFDDELVKLEGHQSVEDFKKLAESDFNNYVKNSRLNAAVDHFIDTIVLNSKFETVPQSFVDGASEELMSNHVRRFNGDLKKAMEAVGAVDDGDFYNKFAGQVMKDLAQSLALNKYADMHNLERGNREVIFQHMVDSINWL
jgi:FKBP-type peptidyl-prolyl cis-trans isomerase (trigger factor)